MRSRRKRFRRRPRLAASTASSARTARAEARALQAALAPLGIVPGTLDEADGSDVGPMIARRRARRRAQPGRHPLFRRPPHARRHARQDRSRSSCARMSRRGRRCSRCCRAELSRSRNGPSGVDRRNKEEIHAHRTRRIPARCCSAPARSARTTPTGRPASPTTATSPKTPPPTSATPRRTSPPTSATTSRRPATRSRTRSATRTSRSTSTPAKTRQRRREQDQVASRSSGDRWSGRQDSNLRPSAPKADALPGCATPRHPPYADRPARQAPIGGATMVGPAGFEPTT